MLKKQITYIDFNGTERTEDFYFNLTETEILEMEAEVNGGLSEMLKLIISEQDNPKIVEAFKKIISKAYGVKSLDGKYFIKTEEGLKKFQATMAYSQFFMEISTNADKAADFINNINPKFQKK
jgi:hypothetical protein